MQQPCANLCAEDVLSAQLGLTAWEDGPTMIKNQRRDAARIIRGSK